MVSFFRQPFTLLDPARNRLFLVLFCGVFAIFFLYVFNPYGSHDWEYEAFVGTRLALWTGGILAMPVLLLTQFAPRALFNLKPFRNYHFLFLLAVEILLLSWVFYLFFGDMSSARTDPFNEYLSVLKHTILLAIIPYLVALLMIKAFYWERKTEELTAKSSAPASTFREELLTILDEKDNAIWHIQAKQLLYLKSEDNYTAIYYLQSADIRKKLIRTNIKKLASELNYPGLLRVHRSFMVNLDHLQSISKRSKGIQIHLAFVPDTPIPVSSTYQAQLEEKIDG